MKAQRVAVAVAFGLIGFAVNFLDIEFMEGATFKISILAGLFFPLVVALAWGWRYGLLSALAGGCQTMWWLWQGDGWGFFIRYRYSRYGSSGTAGVPSAGSKAIPGMFPRSLWRFRFASSLSWAFWWCFDGWCR